MVIEEFAMNVDELEGQELKQSRAELIDNIDDECLEQFHAKAVEELGTDGMEKIVPKMVELFMDYFRAVGIKAFGTDMDDEMEGEGDNTDAIEVLGAYAMPKLRAKMVKFCEQRAMKQNHRISGQLREVAAGVGNSW